MFIDHNYRYFKVEAFYKVREVNHLISLFKSLEKHKFVQVSNYKTAKNIYRGSSKWAHCPELKLRGFH